MSSNVLPTVVINRNGNKVTINESDFVNGEMDLWKDEPKKEVKSTDKGTKEAVPDVEKENVTDTIDEPKKVTPKKARTKRTKAKKVE